MSPGLTARPLIMFSVAPTTPRTRTGARSSASAAIASITARAAAHVELHVDLRGPRLELQAAAVERDRLADQRQAAGASAAPPSYSSVIRRGSCSVPWATAAKAPIPRRADLVATGHGHSERLVLLGEPGGVVAQGGGGEVVGRRVAQVAGAVLGGDQGRRAADGGRNVVAVTEDQRLQSRGLVGGRWLVTQVAIGRQDRALHERLDDLGTGRRRNLPAQRLTANLAGSALDQGGDPAGAFGVELRAGAEPGQDQAATVMMGQCQPAVGGAGLVRCQQGGQLAARAGRRPLPRPRNTPTAMVSALVASGGSVLASTCTG